MNFTFHGKETLVEYTYPWLPPKCTTCEKWGHLAKACLRQSKPAEDVESSVEESGESQRLGSQKQMEELATQKQREEVENGKQSTETQNEKLAEGENGELEVGTKVCNTPQKSVERSVSEDGSRNSNPKEVSIEQLEK